MRVFIGYLGKTARETSSMSRILSPEKEMKIRIWMPRASDMKRYDTITRGSDRSSTRPRKRLPASTATSMKYGKELLDTRSVPSRSAAIDW